MEVKTPPLSAAAPPSESKKRKELDPSERERRFRDIQRRVGNGADGISSVGSATPRVEEEGPPSLKHAEESGAGQAPSAAPAPVLSAPTGTPETGTLAAPTPKATSSHITQGNNSPQSSNYNSSPANGTTAVAVSQPSSIVTPSARDSPKKPMLSSPRSRRGIPSPSSRSRGTLNWKKGKLLGQGGFGTVYLGLAEDRGQLIAVKNVSTVGADKEAIAQLRNEVELMEKLQHKSIVQYIGMEENIEVGYVNIFMEYVPGGPISSVLTEFGPFTHEVASSFARQVIEGLIYLHGKGVVHRDIKGANILLHSDADLRLADFGAAVQLAKVRGMRLRGGTAFWMPPEVIVEEITAPVTWRQDIWSLGCLVIEMLTAKAPFKWLSGTDEDILMNIANTEIDVPMPPIDLLPAAQSFLRLCLQKNPDKRPEAKELLGHDFIKMSEGNPALKDKEDIKNNPAAALSPRTKGKRLKGTPKAGPPLSPTDRARLDRKLQKLGADDASSTPASTVSGSPGYPHSRTVPGSPEYNNKDRQSFLGTSSSYRRRSTNSISRNPSGQGIQWASSGSDGDDGGREKVVALKKPQKLREVRKKRLLDFSITLSDEERDDRFHGLVFSKSMMLESVAPNSLGYECGLSAAIGWILVRIDDRPAMVTTEVNRILSQSKTDRQASMQTFKDTPPESEPQPSPLDSSGNAIPLASSSSDKIVGVPSVVPPITLKLIQFKSKDEVEVLRSSKQWHKCQVYKIDKIKSKVVVYGTQGVGAEEKSFSKELIFSQVEQLLRTPRGSPKTVGTPSLQGISIPLTPLHHININGDDAPPGMLSPLQTIPTTGSIVSSFTRGGVRGTPKSGSPTREYLPGSPDGSFYNQSEPCQRFGSILGPSSPNRIETRSPPVSGNQVSAYRDPTTQDVVPSPTGLSTVGSGIFKQYNEQTTISPTGMSAKGSGVFGASRGLNSTRGRNSPKSLRHAAANEAAASEDAGSPLNQMRGISPFSKKNNISERRGADSVKVDLNHPDNNSFGKPVPTRCSTADTEVLTQHAGQTDCGTPNIISPPERLISPITTGDQSMDNIMMIPGTRSSFRSKVAAFIQDNAVGDPSTQQWSTPNFMPAMTSPVTQFVSHTPGSAFAVPSYFSSPPADAIDEVLIMSQTVEVALIAAAAVLSTAVVVPTRLLLRANSSYESLSVPSKRGSVSHCNPILSAARDMYIPNNLISSGPLLSPKTALESETVGEAAAPVAPSPTLQEVCILVILMKDVIYNMFHYYF